MEYNLPTRINKPQLHTHTGNSHNHIVDENTPNTEVNIVMILFFKLKLF
jgi:hypothetical protein